VEDQDEISASLNTTDAKIRTAERKRNQLQDLFRTLLHQLMTAEIRVNDLDLEELDILEQAV
jgi:type I restriction enzyme S subunit